MDGDLDDWTPAKPSAVKHGNRSQHTGGDLSDSELKEPRCKRGPQPGAGSAARGEDVGDQNGADKVGPSQALGAQRRCEENSPPVDAVHASAADGSVSPETAEAVGPCRALGARKRCDAISPLLQESTAGLTGSQTASSAEALDGVAASCTRGTAHKAGLASSSAGKGLYGGAFGAGRGTCETSQRALAAALGAEEIGRRLAAIEADLLAEPPWAVECALRAEVAQLHKAASELTRQFGGPWAHGSACREA